MLKYIKLLILFWALFLSSAVGLEAAGLSTGFSEVTLEDLEIGQTYSTKEIANLPLEVVNTGDEPVDLKIELLAPQTGELKEGFAPIPDSGWIELGQTEFKEIMPNESATTDVIVSIPDDEQYLGKKYQVFIWTHSTGKSIGLGLKSKLLLKISPTPVASVSEEIEPAMPPVTVIPEGIIDDKRR